MSNHTKGVISIIFSAFGFAIMAMFVRLCDDYGEEVSSLQKSFFRNIIAFTVAAVVYARSRTTKTADATPQPLDTKALTILLVRCVAGCIGIFANFYALSKIPIAEAMTLNKTAPFFTIVFSWMFLKETPNLRQLLAIFIAFSGVMLVVKPGFTANDMLASCCALAGGLGAGIAYTCVRELGVRKINTAFIVLFFSAFSSLASIPFMINSFSPMSLPQTIILLGAGAGAAIGQFGVTTAYRFAPPRRIAVYDYTNIIFTAALGYLAFGQIPDTISTAGFIAIIAAAILTNAGKK